MLKYYQIIYKTMSWTKGARRDYPPNLKITDDNHAIVVFLSEPKTRSFGKKKTRRGEEVDDIRTFAQVRYLEGTARAKVGSEDSYPAVAGEEYTLWMSTTLTGKILEVLNWQEGQPDPLLSGSKWKIWRSQERRGGNRIYDAELLAGTKAIETSQTTVTPPSPKPDKAEDLDGIALQLAGSLKNIKKVDLATWKNYCNTRGVDADKITKRMVELQLVTVDSTHISYKES